MQEDSKNTSTEPQQSTIDRIKLYQISPETENNQRENFQDNEEEIEYVESFMGIDEIASKINKKENEGVRKDIETYPWADGIEGEGEFGLVQEDGHVVFKGNDLFANYQMGMAIKSSMEREARKVKEDKNPEEKEDIDIGEVGEWMEKSANIRKNSHNDHDDSGEFEGIFPEGSTAYQEEAKSSEIKKQGVKSYNDSTVQEISRKYNNMQMMMNTHNTEVLNMLLEIAENGLEGDQDLATLMEQIYQAEGAGNVGKEELTNQGENDEIQKMMNQEEFEALYMNSQINEGLKEKEESPLESPNIEGKANQGIITKEDWEVISKNNLSQIMQKPERDPHMPDKDPIITFEEVWKIVLQEMDLREVKRQVALEVNDSQGFFRKFLSALNSLPENLIEERNTFLALAKIPFNDQEPLHFKILCAIYRELTGKSGIISRYGEHWEVIGFQGTDPATDLRGAGILGLMQLLAFVGQHKELVRKIWGHSRHETFHFPFAVCGLNMTQIVKELLREGKIDDLIMQERNVMKVCNELYFSVFYKLYDVYKSKNCTIHEYSSVQKEIRGIVRDEPESIMQDFRVNRLLE